jgi:hypothetical protein
MYDKKTLKKIKGSKTDRKYEKGRNVPYGWASQFAVLTEY